ncbi:hypothetical protein IJ101_02510 [Candidatus Saccharibacteria bacterium]|nr:hypothetical protein [Candidatus Saccharibacteria bacterium]
MDNGLSENDPYRGMNSGSDSIRPDFLSKQDAANELKDAEKAASDDMKSNERSLSGARNGEDRPSKLFTGSGKNLTPGKPFTSIIKGFVKKRGPVVAIFGAIVGVGALMFGGQTMMPVAISEMIIQKLNSVGVSSTIASDVWLDTQLNAGIRPEGAEITEENKYAISQYQVRSFKAQGLKVEGDVGGARLLYEKKPNGGWVTVAGSASGGGISAQEALKDRDFRIPYTAAAKGWRGGGSGWFDTMMNNITTTKLAISRNRWAGYVARSAGKMTEDFKKMAEGFTKKNTSDAEIESSKEMTVEEYESTSNGTGKPLVDGDTVVPYEGEAPDGGIGEWDSSAGIKQNGEALDVVDVEELYEQIPVKDPGTGEIVGYEDGTTITGYKVTADNSASTVNDVTDVGSLNGKLLNKAMSVANSAATAVNLYCAKVEAFMSIYTVASAFQSLQFLNLISGFLESVDKMKAGQGVESPIHEYSTNLTVKAETVAAEGDPTDGTEEKTAMESKGMAWLFSDTPINSNDTSVRNTNFESIMEGMSDITSDIRLTAEVFKQCGYAKIATSGLELVSTAMSLIPLAGQAITFTQVAVKIGKKVALGLAIRGIFETVMPIVAKKIFNSIVKNAATEWFGEDLGNAMISGASKYLGGNGTSGGQSPGSAEKVLAYLGEQQTVIANEAEYQRAIRSPFDVTSPYTFLGSLAYSIIPMAYSGGGFSNIVTNMSTLTSNSIAAISPGASAVDINRKIDSVGECPLLENMGAVGDAYCNPYVITDVSTIMEAPATVTDTVKEMGVLKEDGTIDDSSNLAKYITFCGQRTSQLGLKDSGIIEKLQDGIEETENEEGQKNWIQKGFNWLGSTLSSVFPGISETQNVLVAIRDADLMQWANGEACVASDENEYWAENKNYQRYAENERLLENINPGYTSPVTAYLEKYYKENPVDTSFEGTLARFSGKSVEEVESTLALVVYYDQLAKYRPSERYAFVEKEEKGVELKFDNDNAIAENVYYILPNEIAFADVRNRQNTTI